jgi:spoIIIJ-associated protein
MKRIEADTLEDAYSKAAKELSCSVTEINYEIVQYPTSGVMGLFKKTAIIIAVKKSVGSTETLKEEKVKEETLLNAHSQKPRKDEPKQKEKKKEARVEAEKVAVKEKTKATPKTVRKEKKDAIVDNFFSEKKTEDPVVAEISEDVDFGDDRDTPENKALSLEIEKKIQELMKVACFEIDTVEVDVFKGIAHIFIDGEDAALLIGKEGYRYNALSYMFFNWINARYDLYIKLEIAEFIQAQEEMIDNYLKPISAHIIEHGKGKTKPLDGILVQIALEKLRAMFPNKYIAIKTGKDGKKFIIINDFNTRKSN